MRGVRPLHVRKGKMRACKILEPRGSKKWTLVAIGYDLGTTPLQPARRRRAGPVLPQHCDQQTTLASHRAMTFFEA
jgi:hypothetical protein